MSWRGPSTSPTRPASRTPSWCSSATACTAPEFDWDDFKDLDVKGKTLVVLVNDPPVPAAADPSELDAKIFGGRAMTYYGRWTYKYEKAARTRRRRRAHRPRDRPGRLPVRGGAGHGRRAPRPRDAGQEHGPRRTSRAGCRSTRPRKLMTLAGQDFDALKTQALTRDFKPVPLGLTASMAIATDDADDRVEERAGEARGQRPGAEGRVRRLHRALGSLRRRRSRSTATTSTTARSTTRRARRWCSRSRARSRRSRPQPKRSVLFLIGDRRRAGPARVGVLRRVPAVPAREDGRRHQHRRHQPVGPHEGPRR